MKGFILSTLVAAFALTAPSMADAKVTVYQHCGYKGYRITLGVGTYNLGRLKRLGVKNDDLSAISVTPGYTVTVYEHAGFRGRSLTFTSNAPCLKRHRFNDIISSMVVSKVAPPRRKKFVASVYKHCGYKGTRVDLHVGSYTLAMLMRRGMRNDDISSLVLAPGYKATLFVHDNFRGKRVTFYGSDKCFVDNGINDKVSSIIITRR
ncbi:hypothetical protein KKF84_09745 [Myxococcota bacterium]|nr:hypothetical protein [Myxococcota bacterium]MBU1535594.1 hypothetical protein [Myxococcota bacterium]